MTKKEVGGGFLKPGFHLYDCGCAHLVGTASGLGQEAFTVSSDLHWDFGIPALEMGKKMIMYMR